MIPAHVANDVYDFLTDDEDARVCRDIPDGACREQPRNYLVHLTALALTKTGDKFADPKIVLSWLASALGAPGVVGLLVPVRESVSLLPQMAVAGAIRRLPVRKWLWCAGSLGQAAALVVMGFVALSLQGAVAGWSIVAALAVFSLSRGVCSVTHKDVVGKTISKTRRGGVSGYADAAAGAATALLAVWLIAGGQREIGVVALMLFVAAALWTLAAAIYAMLAETPGATEGGGDALDEARRQMRLLVEDAPFRNFVLARAALLGTALVAPYFVSLAQAKGAGSIAGFGALLLAASIASFLASPFWGRFSDVSSRKVMAAGGALGGLTGLGLAAALALGVTHSALFAAAIFLLYVAHAGVRTGRKTHVVDIANEETRAAYVAVSNTLIGVALIASAGLGWVAGRFGDLGALVFFSGLALVGAAASLRLGEAQQA